MRRIQFAVFAVSCVLGASLIAGHASAWWKSVHVSGCTMSPYAADLSMVWGGGVGYYNYGSKPVTFHCNAENNSDHPKESVGAMWVQVTDQRSDAEVTARVCVGQGVSWGGGCGVVTGSGNGFNGGTTYLYPSLNVWRDPTYSYDSGYLVVTVPPFLYSPTGGGGALVGYTVTF
jgi:hypothetical protein